MTWGFRMDERGVRTAVTALGDEIASKPPREDAKSTYSTCLATALQWIRPPLSGSLSCAYLHNFHRRPLWLKIGGAAEGRDAM